MIRIGVDMAKLLLLQRSCLFTMLESIPCQEREREIGYVAHRLAKEGLSLMDDLVHIEKASYCILDIVAAKSSC